MYIRISNQGIVSKFERGHYRIPACHLLTYLLCLLFMSDNRVQYNF